MASPLFPYSYANAMQTTWHIQVPSGNYIELVFEELDIQSQKPVCLQDYLMVYDVSEIGDVKVIARLCNAKPPSGSYFSSWHRMQIFLFADRKFNAKGFLAKYTSRTFELPNELLDYITFNCKYIINSIEMCNYIMR